MELVPWINLGGCALLRKAFGTNGNDVCLWSVWVARIFKSKAALVFVLDLGIAIDPFHRIVA